MIGIVLLLIGVGVLILVLLLRRRRRRQKPKQETVDSTAEKNLGSTTSLHALLGAFFFLNVDISVHSNTFLVLKYDRTLRR